MPELPEVETTLRGIAPYIEKKKVLAVDVRQRKLRWPVPKELEVAVSGQQVRKLSRRGKYLLFHFKSGVMLVHLGMSGNLRIVSQSEPVGKHDHIDFMLSEKRALRFTDPRKFGCVLWSADSVGEHPLLAHLGPEPLDDVFDAEYLVAKAGKRKVPVKSLIMDAKVVVGVGNIYANEALFMAGIQPLKAAGKVSKKHYALLVVAIKEVLAAAIKQGGTTLKDFYGGDGKPGYFKQQLQVYGRAGEPCVLCASPLVEKRIAQRSTVYCKRCQK